MALAVALAVTTLRPVSRSFATALRAGDSKACLSSVLVDPTPRAADQRAQAQAQAQARRVLSCAELAFSDRGGALQGHVFA